jgi:hypothetical protein
VQVLGTFELPALVATFVSTQSELNSNNTLAIAGNEGIKPTTVSVFHSATSIFHAPSDLSGAGGMRRERIHARPVWRHSGTQYDPVLINADPSQPGMSGMLVARVRCFMSIKTEDGKAHDCALIHWFSTIGDKPGENTGMWIVEPDFDSNGNAVLSVVHIDTIIRATFLLPIYSTQEEHWVAQDHRHGNTLDTFTSFYINRFADYHMFKIMSIN